MESVAKQFIDDSRTFLKDDFLPKMNRALLPLSDDDLWWRPNEASNSIGNLILHLCGNLRMWIVAALGGAALNRNREAEFTERRPVPKAELLSMLQQAIQETDVVLAALQEDVLSKQYKISKFNVSGLWAIYHVVEHFSYHLGQVLYISKLRTGKSLE